jgi:(p)ppGpp synthase/HD superfamily hydrolase
LARTWSRGRTAVDIAGDVHETSRPSYNLGESMAKAVRCDQCVACMINGVYCHEIGCPNMNKTYSKREGRWVKKKGKSK